MKNSHQCIYHLIFNGQECTVPYVSEKKNSNLYYYMVGYINTYFAMLDNSISSIVNNLAL